MLIQITKSFFQYLLEFTWLSAFNGCQTILTARQLAQNLKAVDGRSVAFKVTTFEIPSPCLIKQASYY